VSLKFMQDGPAITHNDLPSAEGLRLILEGEATSSLREIVSSMGHQIQIDPDDLDSFAADGDMSDNIIFTRLRRFLLELLLLCPLRVLVSYTRTVWQWPCPPSAEYNTRLALGQDLATDGRDPFRQLRHFSRYFGLPEEPVIAVAATTTRGGLEPDREHTDASGLVADDITFGSFPAQTADDFGDSFRVPFSADPTGLPNARISDANPMASFLRTEDGLREMQRLLQDFVVRPDFHLPAAASARQLRAVREWLLPTADQCPELHAHLPEGYGLPDFVLETGHNSPHILTSEERRALREQVPYHLHAPEPSELKQQDKATLPANVVSADNASREQQVKLRPRINSNVYALATLFDPSVTDVRVLQQRLAPVFAAQLKLIFDEWAKRDQERRARLVSAQVRGTYTYDQRGDIPRPSLLTSDDRTTVADRMQLLSANARAFGHDQGTRGRGGGKGNRGGKGKHRGGRGETAPAPAPGPGPAPAPGNGGKGGKKGKKGKSKGAAVPDPPAAQAARDSNEGAADASADASN
jgi:hypothetical protein